METKTKKCPYCGEEILEATKKCRYCGEWLERLEEGVRKDTLSVESLSNNLNIGQPTQKEKIRKPFKALRVFSIIGVCLFGMQIVAMIGVQAELDSDLDEIREIGMVTSDAIEVMADIAEVASMFSSKYEEEFIGLATYESRLEETLSSLEMNVEDLSATVWLSSIIGFVLSVLGLKASRRKELVRKDDV